MSILSENLFRFYFSYPSVKYDFSCDWTTENVETSSRLCLVYSNFSVSIWFGIFGWWVYTVNSLAEFARLENIQRTILEIHMMKPRKIKAGPAILVFRDWANRKVHSPSCSPTLTKWYLQFFQVVKSKNVQIPFKGVLKPWKISYRLSKL